MQCRTASCDVAWPVWRARSLVRPGRLLYFPAVQPNRGPVVGRDTYVSADRHCDTYVSSKGGAGASTPDSPDDHLDGGIVLPGMWLLRPRVDQTVCGSRRFRLGRP